MPVLLLPATGKRASLQMQQVSVSELPVPVRQVSASQRMPVLQVSVPEPEPVPQVSVSEQMPVPQVSVTGPPAPALQVSVSGLLPASRLHSSHWQVY